VRVDYTADRAVENPSPQSSPLREGERRIQRSPKMSLSAVLLAGGESLRMGKDKATVLFRGKLLWDVQLDLLRKLEPEEILISARTDPPWRPEDVQLVTDDPPSRGPLSGLAASLARMRSAHLLALAIDMPFMSEKFLRYLCGQIEPGVGVVPKIENRAEPLAAIYPREAEIDFREALAGDDFSLQTLVRRLVAAGKLLEVTVTEQERKLFLNVNQLSDLAAL
jgi:molybdopterin-guanine dinucleotide biosynthesis protein A